jgi:antitoxin MazE
MEMIIKKWGNSLATRIPKAIASMINLQNNQKINIETENGKIIITPLDDKKIYTMDELLSQSTPESVKLDEDDKNWLNAEPVGKEW